MSETEAPHSELYLDDSRDHWWNADFLGRFAGRTGLSRCRHVLDAGCGLGHFGRALAPHLPPDFSLVGVDREPRWVEGATRRAAHFLRERAPGATMSYREGSVEALPFPDGSFDAAVCQTLLMHVRSPEAAMRELCRVVKPGGLVLVAEPNNLGGLQGLAAGGGRLRDPDEVARQVAITLRILRGKLLLGEGDNNLGVRLPQLFAGLRDVQYAANDRPHVLAPPYATAAEQAMIASLRSQAERGIWGWPREEARRYFVAGGGGEEAFAGAYELMLAVQREELLEIDAGTRTELLAVALLLAAGRTPG